jgi:hypothetical protein
MCSCELVACIAALLCVTKALLRELVTWNKTPLATAYDWRGNTQIDDTFGKSVAGRIRRGLPNLLHPGKTPLCWSLRVALTQRLHDQGLWVHCQGKCKALQQGIALGASTLPSHTLAIKTI